MGDKELEDQIYKIVGIDPAVMFVDESQWSISTVAGNGLDNSAKISFSTSENPPEDPLADLLTSSLASHYIIDRISRDELVTRLLKIWPNAGGLDLSQFMDKLDIDKDAYWRKVRGEEQVGK